MNIHWIKRYNFWNSSFLTFPHRSFILVDRKSAADERLALSVTQRNEPIPWGRAAHFFLCSRLRNSSIRAMMTSANWHKSLKFSSSFISVIPLSVLDWGIFSYSRNVPSHGTPKCIWGLNRPPLWQHPNRYHGPLKFYQKFFYLASFTFTQKKPATLPVFLYASTIVFLVHCGSILSHRLLS